MAKPEEPPAERPVEEFAEELNRVLGVAEARAKDWLGQRQQIVKTLEGIRDRAVRLLRQLGHDTQPSVYQRGRPVGSGRDPGRPRMHTASDGKGSGRTRRAMSAEARERIRQGQLKRWAKLKAAGKKK
jgi:hypothetical protein